MTPGADSCGGRIPGAPRDPANAAANGTPRLAEIRRWLLKGVGIKRWLILLALTSLGFGVALACLFLGFGGGRSGALAFALLALYMILLVIASLRVLQFVERMTHIARDGRLEDWFDDLSLAPAAARIVAIGGGTGLSTLLRGLRDRGAAGSEAPPREDKFVTALVTVTDDGGSSGRLRDDLHILPPGDIRNCIAALSHEESLLRNLFQYRFPEASQMAGHSFGNLFLAAMTAVTGRFDLAIAASSKVLAVRGTILPATLDNVRLTAVFVDGSTAVGETAITAAGRRIHRLALVPETAEPMEGAVAALLAADAIILGPGSLYTSIVPNLLIRGIREAILRSSAVRIYVANVMTQPGETDGFTLADHVETVATYLGGLPDIVVANDSPMPAPLLARYAATGARPVAIDAERMRGLGVALRLGDFLYVRDYLRHDPAKLAEFLVALVKETRAARATR